MKRTNDQRELRYVPARELRASADGNIKKIAGYAAVYNSRSVDLGGFVEVIQVGAFDTALQPDADVLCLRDHDVSLLMGRTKSGTLKLSSDEVGLHFEVILPDTDSANSLYESVKRGDLDACSFGFSVVSDSWEQIGNQVLRTLIEVELFEVSIVSFPAYPATTAAIRSCPPEIRSLIETLSEMQDKQARTKSPDSLCQCPCGQCMSDACNLCSVDDCIWLGCSCPGQRNRHDADIALASVLNRRIK